ncbi:MAG: amino acid ABC transporter permease [Acetobacteraceae bacterium]|nr:amino acid ABC transporter permease [Acetobacteraceae bacterium]
MGFSLHFGPILQRWPDFLGGALLTVELAAISSALGLALAVPLALLRGFGPRAARWLVTSYVELIRNTPLLVQLYLVYFALPKAGLKLDSNQAAIVALSANLAAYAAEIIRAGLAAVPRGQVEAGFSLGLKRLRIIRHIVLAPAVRAVYPALGSQFVLQILGSSLVSAIAAEELTAVSNNIMMETFRNFEVFIVAGGLYLLMVLFFRLLFAGGERTLFRWSV